MTFHDRLCNGIDPGEQVDMSGIRPHHRSPITEIVHHRGWRTRGIICAFHSKWGGTGHRGCREIRFKRLLWSFYGYGYRRSCLESGVTGGKRYLVAPWCGIKVGGRDLVGCRRPVPEVPLERKR